MGDDGRSVTVVPADADNAEAIGERMAEWEQLNPGAAPADADSTRGTVPADADNT